MTALSLVNKTAPAVTDAFSPLTAHEFTPVTGNDSRENARLCAIFSRAQAEDPIGMAPTAPRYVLMELPAPWDRNLRRSQHFPPTLAAVLDTSTALASGQLRFHCLLPDADYSVPGHTHLLTFDRPAGACNSFQRTEYLVPTHLAPALAIALVEQPDGLHAFSAYLVPEDTHSEPVRDLLVCTHGAVDACCARLGYPLYERLRREHAAPSGGRLRAWRVSHFGGHRLAPTLIDFPEGRYWGHLTAPALDALVHRSGPVADLRRHYRGWGALTSRWEQIAEGAIFAAEGWPWRAYQVRGATLHVASDRSSADVRLTFSSPDGAVCGAYEATVEICGSVPSIHCMEDGETSITPQYRVTRLVRAVHTD